MDVEAVVVGAGHAGLAASWALLERGLEHVVLEEGRIGQTWREDRWSSFRLNTARSMSRLPGASPGGADPDGFDTAHEFADALVAFRDLHRLPVTEHAGPASVARDAGGLRVDTPTGSVRAGNVIVATGFQKIVAVPPAAAALGPRLLQLDTCTYRSPDQLPDGGVLVVGGGQSGCQIAEDLVDAGRRVVLATSRVGRVPRRYRGRDTLAWWTESGFYEQRRADVDPAVLDLRQPLLSGTDDGHSLSLQSLARRGVLLLGRLQRCDNELLEFGDEAAENVRFGDQVAATLLRSIDEYIAGAGIAAEPAVAEPADEPIAGLGDDAPRSLRLDRAGIGTVIWCTGMRPRLDALGIPGVVSEGAVKHTDGATPVDGLFVIGAPWLSTRKSGIIWGASADAERIADVISGRR
ncbi:MAG TPA: NAD(P)-binding domain-containing protein [Gaiellales bacterium]